MPPPLFRERLANRKIQPPKSSDYREPWVTRHTPQTSSELAVNDKKIREIDDFLQKSTPQKILVVSGPAGSGKSTTLRVLAKERALKVIEYHSPETIIGSTGVVQNFRDFLAGASIYDRKTSLILIEELPNVLHDTTRVEFEATLLDWIAEPNMPLIAISFTEIEVNAKYSEAILVSRVLSQLAQHPLCAHIKVNPPSVTILKKALKKVSDQEYVNVPPPVMKELSECGDIRNALIALEMFTRSAPSPSPPKLAPESHVWVRDSTTELFHAVGKVVWTSKKKNSLEEAMERFHDTIDFFNLTVLENYTSAKHQRLPVSSAASVTEWLSLADVHPGLGELGSLGAAHAIETAREDPKFPKKFVSSRLTQFPKCRRQKLENWGKVAINIRNRRLYSNYTFTPTSLVLDEWGYRSKLARLETALDDYDDDLDSDIDFDTFN